MNKLRLDDLAVTSFIVDHAAHEGAASLNTDIRVCPVSYGYNCNPTFQGCYADA